MKSLRIYLESGARVKHGLSFWSKILNPSLAGYLLKEAKKEGVNQAIFLNVQSGFLKGKSLSYFVSENIPKDFPVVLELIDEESKLFQFYNLISNQLTDECVVLQDLELLRSNLLTKHKEV